MRHFLSSWLLPGLFFSKDGTTAQPGGQLLSGPLRAVADSKKGRVNLRHGIQRAFLHLMLKSTLSSLLSPFGSYH